MTNDEWLAEAMRLADERCELHATKHGYGSGKVREALRAHLATRPAQEWLPIETAPKDCTDVLLHIPGRVPVVAAWYRRGWTPMDSDDGPLSSEPTHWMPLPAAPKQENP